MKKGLTVSEMCQKLNIPPDQLLSFFSSLDSDNKYIIKNNQIIINKENYDINSYDLMDKDDYHLLVISDTHLGSDIDYIEALKYAYDQAENNEIDLVIHLGDLTDGLFKNQKNDKCKSYSNIRNYAIRYYPFSTIPTLVLAGNHDINYKDNHQDDIVSEICQSRGDLIYLGQKPIRLKFTNYNFLIAHGDDDLINYYNIANKMACQYVMYGHTHHSGYKIYKDVNFIQVPSLSLPRYKRENYEQIGMYWLEVNKKVIIKLDKLNQLKLKLTNKN